MFLYSMHCQEKWIHELFPKSKSTSDNALGEDVRSSNSLLLSHVFAFILVEVQQSFLLNVTTANLKSVCKISLFMYHNVVSSH